MAVKQVRSHRVSVRENKTEQSLTKKVAKEYSRQVGRKISKAEVYRVALGAFAYQLDIQ